MPDRKYANCLECWRNLGSAAMLNGEQKLLFIFVNDNGADYWTIALRTPVEIKIERSLRWLEDKARRRGIQLNLQHVCVPLKPSIACCIATQINQSDYKAGPGHSTWQNQIVTKLTSRGSVAERWNDLFKAYGLPLNGAEGTAVFFCVRRHVRSVAFPFSKGQDIEFKKERGIIYDNGGNEGQRYLDSLIAHEILHLYGAKDLAPDKIPNSLKKHASQYSNDVMHTPTQHPLSNYCISDLTAYLVGWCETKPACLEKREPGLDLPTLKLR